jgi:phosphoribosylformylglycinamidine (FGAM) synthase PurS component
VDALPDDRLAQIHDIAEKLLSTPVIEDYEVRVEEQA